MARHTNTQKEPSRFYFCSYCRKECAKVCNRSVVLQAAQRQLPYIRTVHLAHTLSISDQISVKISGLWMECITASISAETASLRFPDGVVVQLPVSILHRSCLLHQALSDTKNDQNFDLRLPEGFLGVWLRALEAVGADIPLILHLRSKTRWKR